jgi:hypothetical protein
MSLERLTATAIILAGTATIPLLGATPADADVARGHVSCEMPADHQARGYEARCHPTRDQSFAVHREEPDSGQWPATGSAGRRS